MKHQVKPVVKKPSASKADTTQLHHQLKEIVIHDTSSDSHRTKTNKVIIHQMKIMEKQDGRSVSPSWISTDSCKGNVEFACIKTVLDRGGVEVLVKDKPIDHMDEENNAEFERTTEVQCHDDWECRPKTFSLT